MSGLIFYLVYGRISAMEDPGMHDNDDDSCALASDPEGDAIAELFEPELQEEVRTALRSMKQGVVDASNAREAAEVRLRELRYGSNVITRRINNPF